MAPILTFNGIHSFLSNFFCAEMVWDGIVWPSSEHAYQAAKTESREIRLKFSRMQSPVTVKRAGKTVPLREDWDAVKYDIMLEIVRAKFTQNPELRTKLFETGDAHLEEGNTWHDRTWGVCPPGSSNGLNYLGKILMTVRDELRAEVAK